MNFISKTYRFKCRYQSGITLVELLFAISMILMLSGTIYNVLRAVQKSFIHSRSRLDILQTTRIIMAGLRNELRNAVKKPQVKDEKLNIPISPTETVVYYFDENRRLYRGKKGNMDEPDPDKSEMHPFMFDDGQILKFEFDSSYRDSDAFVESELALNSKVWFKVSMTVLYTEKFRSLSDEEKSKILESTDDPRVKSFFMTITPRKVNWLLQATQ